MDKNKERIARFGIATKGFVYCLIGGLTAATTFGMGGKKTGTDGALQTLGSQPFGQILLGLTVLGLLGFVFWRFYQAIIDPEQKGNNLKGITRRLGYASSGIFYGLLAFTTVKIMLRAGSSSGGGNESMVSTLLGKPYGQILVGILGAIFLGKAIYQLSRAYSGKFKDKVKAAELSKKVEKFVLKTGYIGYTAKGIVIGIISYLTFNAAINYNSDSAGGTKDAFQFLQNEFGSIILGIIALGFFCYGFFMFVKSRYRNINV